jgi:hypothetical protein
LKSGKLIIKKIYIIIKSEALIFRLNFGNIGNFCITGKLLE